MVYPGKFDGIASTGSGDIVGTRICHADADTEADANEIRTETNMSPSPLVGGHNNTLPHIHNVIDNAYVKTVFSS